MDVQKERTEPFMTVAQAEQQLRDAELAAKALSSLEVKLGVDPENIIPNTHKYVDSLQAEKARYDEDIRKHIISTRDVEKFVVSDDDDDKQKIKRTEIEDAKQVLANDRSKIEEINTELKELKDIELMATGLEVAKFLAHERAETSLREARSHVRTTGQISSLAETNLGNSSPLPSAMVQTISSPPVSTSIPLQQPEQLPVEQPPMYFNQPGPAQVYPSSINTPSSATAEVHEIAAQRHNTRPTSVKIPPPSLFTAPLQSLDIHKQFYGGLPSTYNQYAAPEQFVSPGFQMYHAAKKLPLDTNFLAHTMSQEQPEKIIAPPPASFSSAQLYHPPPSLFFQQQQLRHQLDVSPAFQQHAVGDQRHFTAKPQLSLYPSFLPQPSVINTFANPSKEPHGHQADHTHKTTENEKEDNTGETDWLGSMSFPGTTYSPPPSWVRPHQTQPMIQHKLYKQPSLAVTNQPVSVPQYPPPSISLPDEFHPAITGISTGPPLELQKQNQGVAPFSTLKPYKLEPELSHTIETPPPSVSQFANAGFAPETIPVSPFFINNNNPVPSIMQQLTNTQQQQQPVAVNNFASPQPQESQQTTPPATNGGASQVIFMGPDPSSVLINQKQSEPEPPKPAGTLPGYLGAVEMAKYPEDILDRLRNNNRTKQNNDENKTPKRQELVRAEKKLEDVKKASVAVTNVENAVGFDPGSIVKMIDFVKTAAEKDVQLSKDIIDKDKSMIRQIESDLSSKQEPAQKSELDKRSEIKSVAYEHAQEKLKSDQALLQEAQDRLDKIKQMELVLTEIEVAKYIASDRAEKVVEGAKRTITSPAEIMRASRSPHQEDREKEISSPH